MQRLQRDLDADAARVGNEIGNAVERARARIRDVLVARIDAAGDEDEARRLERGGLVQRAAHLVAGRGCFRRDPAT